MICKMIQFLHRVIPLMNIKYAFIRIHRSHCLNCGYENEFEEHIKGIVKSAFGWIESEDSYVQKVIYRIKHETGQKERARRYLIPNARTRWTLAILSALTIVMICFFAVVKGTRISSSYPGSSEITFPRLTIENAELMGKKTRVLIYQTRTVSIIIFSNKGNLVG